MNTKRALYQSYFGFFLSGIIILSIGVLLPDLIDQYQLSYTQAGLLLSSLALGNLVANFLYPMAASKMGTRLAVITTVSLMPIGLLSILLLGNSVPSFMWIAFFLMGISRGSLSVVSNVVVNDVSENKTRDLNILHSSFAVGAFASSFILMLMKSFGVQFEGIIGILSGIGSLMLITYGSIDFRYENDSKTLVKKEGKNLDAYFFTIAFVLFFYLGMENAINGWFMTYLQDMNIVSSELVAHIVSLTWMMIMIGRIFTAFISKKVAGTTITTIYTIGAAVMFFILIQATSSPHVVGSILMMGFFLSGIYPTSVSNLGEYVSSSPKRMSVLFLIASIGGVITPQIIGVIADDIGMNLAMGVIALNVIAMVVLALMAQWINKSKAKNTVD